MVYTTHPNTDPSPKLIRFLKDKLGLSEEAIQLGIRQSKIEQAPLAVVLWSFGLITIDQYSKILNLKIPSGK